MIYKNEKRMDYLSLRKRGNNKRRIRGFEEDGLSGSHRYFFLSIT